LVLVVLLELERDQFNGQPHFAVADHQVSRKGPEGFKSILLDCWTKNNEAGRTFTITIMWRGQHIQVSASELDPQGLERK
jgi:hypothetical protein